MTRILTKEDAYHKLPERVLYFRVEDIGNFPWLKPFIADKKDLERLLDEALSIELSGKKATQCGYGVAVAHKSGYFFLEVTNAPD